MTSLLILLSFGLALFLPIKLVLFHDQTLKKFKPNVTFIASSPNNALLAILDHGTFQLPDWIFKLSLKKLYQLEQDRHFNVIFCKQFNSRDDYIFSQNYFEIHHYGDLILVLLPLVFFKNFFVRLKYIRNFVYQNPLSYIFEDLLN